MDSYSFIDTIQLEKANALARYKRFNNIAKMLKLIEVFFALALISWSSIRLPTLFKLFGEYLYAFSTYILNQHVVFLIGNVIVVFCYIFSGHIQVGNDSASVSPEFSEEENINRSVNHHLKTNDAVLEDEFVAPPNDTISDEEIVAPPNNAVSDEEIVAIPVEELPVMETDFEEEDEEEVNQVVKTESEMAAEVAIKQAAKQIERFQRTQSAKLKREISMIPRRELRRSVTERRGSVVADSGDGEGDGESPVRSSETVERLSNEEFRLAVEAFILKQQSFLKQQTMVEKSYS